MDIKSTPIIGFMNSFQLLWTALCSAGGTSGIFQFNSYIDSGVCILRGNEAEAQQHRATCNHTASKCQSLDSKLGLEPTEQKFFSLLRAHTV